MCFFDSSAIDLCFNIDKNKPDSGNSPYAFKFLASSGVYFNITSAFVS